MLKQDNVLRHLEGWWSLRCVIILEVSPPLAATLHLLVLHVGWPSSSKPWPSVLWRWLKYSHTLDFVFLDGGKKFFWGLLTFTSFSHHHRVVDNTGRSATLLIDLGQVKAYCRGKGLRKLSALCKPPAHFLSGKQPIPWRRYDSKSWWFWYRDISKPRCIPAADTSRQTKAIPHFTWLPKSCCVSSNSASWSYAWKEAAETGSALFWLRAGGHDG